MESDASGKDWGGSEVHDWGVPPPPDSTVFRESHSEAVNPDGLADDYPRAQTDSPTSDTEAAAAISSAVLIAMENWRHSSSVTESHDSKLIGYCLGSGDAAIYAIDDGKDHSMIGRAVGQDDDGCIYCLVARITLDRFEELSGGDDHLELAFADARDISLSSVFEADDVSNVVLVQRYKRIEDVPSEYRPPSPFLRFGDG
jgi:hypothetical protein